MLSKPDGRYEVQDANALFDILYSIQHRYAELKKNPLSTPKLKKHSDVDPDGIIGTMRQQIRNRVLGTKLLDGWVARSAHLKDNKGKVESLFDALQEEFDKPSEGVFEYRKGRLFEGDNVIEHDNIMYGVKTTSLTTSASNNKRLRDYDEVDNNPVSNPSKKRKVNKSHDKEESWASRRDRGAPGSVEDR